MKKLTISVMMLSLMGISSLAFADKLGSNVCESTGTDKDKYKAYWAEREDGTKFVLQRNSKDTAGIRVTFLDAFFMNSTPQSK